MEQNLAVAIMFIVLVSAITTCICAFLSYKLKKQMIRLGITDPLAIQELKKSEYLIKSDPLKWGLVLFFGGIGLIILNYTPYQINSLLPYGIEMVFISIGFISYFFISQKTIK